jgi:twitching motility two-component system response regulator PilG
MSYILLVDDNDDLMENLKLILEMEGYPVKAVSSSVDALDTIDEGTPSLILADVVMAGLNGYDLCQQVKMNADCADVPFIFLSALTTPDDIDRGRNLGADEYVTKPFAIDELLAIVHRYLD